MMMDAQMEPFVYFITRFILGSLFFFQAYDKVFRMGLTKVCDEVCQGMREKGIPDMVSVTAVFTSSYIEMAGGLLLMCGLATIPVLYIFGAHLALVVVVFGYLQGLWDMKHVFPRLALLFFLFVLPREWNIWSLDMLLF